MKKIVLGIELVPNDDAVTLDSIKDALAKLGNLSVFVQAEVVVEPVLDEAATKEVNIYVSADDAEPYQLVDGYSIDGRELSDEEVDSIRYHGVCTKFYAVYPRPDRYGAPLYAAVDAIAEAEVAGHCFAVSHEGLEVNSRSSGDDGCESIWLTIAIHEALHAELMSKAV